MTRDGIEFVKMSAAGNDFVVLAPEQAEAVPGDFEEWVRGVCRRGLSVGSDGVLVVGCPAPGRVRVRFFNPDGSQAFCGNGSRCAARFASLRGWAPPSMVLETIAGDVPATVDGDRVSLRLPVPRDAGVVTLDLDGERLEGRHIQAGSPHFVTFVDSPERAPLERWGPLVRGHRRFGSAGVNLDVAGREPGRLKLRTWERGVERETLACGSGAIATAFAARLEGAPDRVVVVPASGIELEIDFDRAATVMLTGDARLIFEGRLTCRARGRPGRSPRRGTL